MDNSLNLDGLNISWNDSVAKIDTQLGYAGDTFTLSCWINESREVFSSSGGHSHKVSITTNVTPDEVITIIEEVEPINNPKEEVNNTIDITKEEEKKLSTNAKLLLIGGAIILFGVVSFIVNSRRR